MKKVRLLDGSMSSQLKKFGYNTEDHSPHWTFPANQNDNLMRNVYSSFIDLGVDIITTNTYHFGSTLDEKIEQNVGNIDYFEKTCSILEKLAGKAEIFGSVGTLATRYHDCSEYHGNYIDFPDSRNTAMDYFRTILTIFKNRTNIRKLIFETIPSENEGFAALEVLKEFPEFQAVLSFTFKENALLRHGEKIDKIAQEIEKNDQILGIGINCTDPGNVLPVLENLKKYKMGDIFVYPNFGDSRFLLNETFDDDIFNKNLIKSWVDHGATVIGGCCGVNENQMKLLKSIIDNI